MPAMMIVAAIPGLAKRKWAADMFPVLAAHNIIDTSAANAKGRNKIGGWFSSGVTFADCNNLFVCEFGLFILAFAARHLTMTDLIINVCLLGVPS